MRAGRRARGGPRSGSRKVVRSRVRREPAAVADRISHSTCGLHVLCSSASAAYCVLARAFACRFCFVRNRKAALLALELT
eukprot:4240180-Pyramimonas_sp.AAC.1